MNQIQRKRERERDRWREKERERQSEIHRENINVKKGCERTHIEVTIESIRYDNERHNDLF
jgi:hypothetical protein